MSWATPSDRVDVTGTPTIEVQPSLPPNDTTHGKLASSPMTDAPNAATNTVTAARREPPHSTVAMPISKPIITSTSAKDGAKAMTTAVSNASWADHRTSLRTGTTTECSTAAS